MAGYLGRPKVRPERANEQNEVGLATGMYYTPAGGDIMFVEASIRRYYGGAPNVDESMQVGPGGAVSLILTGQLGDLMKESARAAFTYATNNAAKLGIPKDRALLPLVYQEFEDLHLPTALQALSDASGYSVALDTAAVDEYGMMVTARLYNVPVDGAVR